MRRKPANLDTETGAQTGQFCPLCGATLLTDGMYLWCSTVSGKGCAYGVDELVLAITFRDAALNWGKYKPPKPPKPHEPHRYALSIGERVAWGARVAERLATTPDVPSAIEWMVALDVRREDAARLVRGVANALRKVGA